MMQPEQKAMIVLATILGVAGVVLTLDLVWSSWERHRINTQMMRHADEALQLAKEDALRRQVDEL